MEQLKEKHTMKQDLLKMIKTIQEIMEIQVIIVIQEIVETQVMEQ